MMDLEQTLKDPLTFLEQNAAHQVPSSQSFRCIAFLIVKLYQNTVMRENRKQLFKEEFQYDYNVQDFNFSNLKKTFFVCFE